MSFSSSDDDDPYSATNIAKKLNDLKSQKEEEVLELSDEDVDPPATGYVTRSKQREIDKKFERVYQKKAAEVIDLDCSESDEDEFEEQVKSIWGGDFSQVHRFSLKRKQPLKPVFQYYADLHSVGIDKISVKVKMREVTHFDSLDSLDFRVSNFLEANFAKGSDDRNLFSQSSYDDSEKLEFKCLTKNSKRPLVIKLHHKQPMHIFYQMCAAELGCLIENLSIRFDGEVVDQTDTPESLGLDGGECFHLYVKP
ncbi:hypothetical protein AAG570_005509 [Ranatra chinensis]|uniref:Rad60/SUMO-like domain-containing protein n=1 Tax=Ranatra chinensis TaxID=642074 RepID=A0ABD0YG16_9HEMI